MPGISLLLKPASSACNLRCAYCFYKDLSENRSQPCCGRMGIDTLEKAVSEAMACAEGECSFLFQGGEPTLAGLAFYRRLMEIERACARPGLKIFNSLQTNGCGLDREWAMFLAENHFLVGLSLDGPEDIHDRYRRTEQGTGSFGSVRKTAELLARYGVEYSVLSVVTGRSASSAERIYRFFKKQGFRSLQFIPCIDPPGRRGDMAYSLSAESYGDFLIRVFDLWFQDLLRGEVISVRQFDNWLGILLGGGPESCGMVGRCSIQFVVEADGSVYPCDFYALDEWKLGDVGQTPLADMARSDTARRFLEASHRVPAECGGCRYYPLCRNGCRRDREEPDGRTWHCKAHKRFFSQRERQLIRAAQIVHKYRR